MTTIPDWSNVTTPEQFLKMPNQSTGGWFWTGIDLMIFAVIFITLSGISTWEAGLLSACFIGLLMSLFLVYLNLIAFWILGIYIALILAIFIYVIWSNRFD